MRFSTLCLVLLVGSSAWADPEWVPFLGGVADARTERAFITGVHEREDQVVTAVRLTDGKPLWSHPGRPLLAHHGRLLVWNSEGGSLSVTWLDELTGKARVASAQLDSAPAYNFVPLAYLDGDRLRLEWTGSRPVPRATGAQMAPVPFRTGNTTLIASTLRPAAHPGPPGGRRPSLGQGFPDVQLAGKDYTILMGAQARRLVARSLATHREAWQLPLAGQRTYDPHRMLEP